MDTPDYGMLHRTLRQVSANEYVVRPCGERHGPQGNIHGGCSQQSPKGPEAPVFVPSNHRSFSCPKRIHHQTQTNQNQRPDGRRDHLAPASYDSWHLNQSTFENGSAVQVSSVPLLSGVSQPTGPSPNHGNYIEGLGCVAPAGVNHVSGFSWKDHATRNGPLATPFSDLQGDTMNRWMLPPRYESAFQECSIRTTGQRADIAQVHPNSHNPVVPNYPDGLPANGIQSSQCITYGARSPHLPATAFQHAVDAANVSTVHGHPPILMPPVPEPRASEIGRESKLYRSANVNIDDAALYFARLLRVQRWDLAVARYLSKVTHHYFAAIVNVGWLSKHEPRRNWNWLNVSAVDVQGQLGSPTRLCEILVWGPETCELEQAVPSLLSDWKRKDLDEGLLKGTLDFKSYQVRKVDGSVMSVAEPLQQFHCEFCL